jgi:AcrR family transcriptional regulator
MLRADAQDNRDRILDAARALFAEHGLDVTVREIARRAGVGPATLYRRFPTRQQLVDEAFADELRACEQIVDDAVSDPDPWRGFGSVVEELTVLNSRNRGFVDAFMSANRHTDVFVAGDRAATARRFAALAVDALRASDTNRPLPRGARLSAHVVHSAGV